MSIWVIEYGGEGNWRTSPRGGWIEREQAQHALERAREQVPWETYRIREYVPKEEAEHGSD